MRRLGATLVVVSLLPFLACASGGSKKPPMASSDESNPLYAFTLMRQGSVLLQQRNYPEALKRFEDADRHKPGNASVHNMIGLCHLRMESFDLALIAFNRSLDFIPAFTDARNNRGATYLAMGQFHLAEVDFVSVLADSTYPHRWQVYYNLGMTYLKRGRLGAADENFRRSASAASPVFESFLRLSEIAQEQGRIKAAVEWLEEARFKFPERLEGHMELGRLLWRLGRCQEARPYLEHVVDSDPGSGLAADARAMLEDC